MAEGSGSGRGARHWGAIFLVLLAVAGLGAAVLALPDSASGLRPMVESRMPERPLANAVTLVLMDFRGYDTLLEFGVLLLAVLAIWSLAEAPSGPADPPAPILRSFVHMVAPILVLIAGYLLWAGSDQPGGEFQAGAVLGALGVLLLLAGWRPPDRLWGWPLRLALVAGPLVFLSVAVGVMALGGRFLEYPQAQSKALIMLIEVAATISIGAVLTSLYVGGRPPPPDKGHGEERS